MTNIFDDIQIKYTRQQYLNNEVSHNQYYSQFCGKFFESLIKENMSEQLDKMTSMDMSEIKLSEWDGFAIFLMNHYKKDVVELFKKAGDIVSQAGLVCLLKASAKKYLVKTKYFSQLDVHELLDNAHTTFARLKTLYLFYYNAPTCTEEDEARKNAFKVYREEIKLMKEELTEFQAETARLQALNILEMTNKAINRLN